MNIQIWKMNFLKEFGFSNLNSFSFSKDGFLALLLKLNKKEKLQLCWRNTKFN